MIRLGMLFLLLCFTADSVYAAKKRNSPNKVESLYIGYKQGKFRPEREDLSETKDKSYQLGYQVNTNWSIVAEYTSATIDTTSESTESLKTKAAYFKVQNKGPQYFFIKGGGGKVKLGENSPDSDKYKASYSIGYGAYLAEGVAVEIERLWFDDDYVFTGFTGVLTF